MFKFNVKVSISSRTRSNAVDYEMITAMTSHLNLTNVLKCQPVPTHVKNKQQTRKIYIEFFHAKKDIKKRRKKEDRKIKIESFNYVKDVKTYKNFAK